MPESESSQAIQNKLPVPISDSRKLTPVGKKSKIIGALAVFAPLAVEVVYGLTRKWLGETSISDSSRRAHGISNSSTPGQQVVSSNYNDGYRHRHRGSRK